MIQNTTESIAISVVYADQSQSVIRDFRLPTGSTLADALAAARASGAFPPDEDASWGYAIFGQRADPATTLHDGDRVELLRPLRCDPKESRRRRARYQGSELRHSRGACPRESGGGNPEKTSLTEARRKTFNHEKH
ncbi:MAG: RnfH family protein, partial [Burkholderiales bacterium]|nr:RnfH family protein [Burkholderiales bacterium]